MSPFSRFLLIALMLVLLPLRGWAGNIMAIDMRSTTGVQAKMAGAAAQTPMPADCIMPSQTPNDGVDAMGCQSDTCELCLAVADLTPAPWSAGSLLRHSLPLALSASFRTASRATHIKPPIF